MKNNRELKVDLTIFLSLLAVGCAVFLLIASLTKSPNFHEGETRKVILTQKNVRILTANCLFSSCAYNARDEYNKVRLFQEMELE